MMFRQKEYDEIFLKGLQNSFEQRLISRQDDFLNYIRNREDIENFYVMLESIHAEWLAEMYEDMQLIYLSDFINKAVGDDLDKIGEKVGITRAGQTKSCTDVTLTLSKVQDTDINIPEGKITLSTKSGILYMVDGAVSIPAGQLSVNVPAYSLETGQSTKINKNTLTLFKSNVSEYNLKKCNNPSPSSGGDEAQTDDDYREYLKNWTTIHRKSDEWAYKYYMNKYNGLDGYALLPCWDGAGTIKVIVDRALNSNSSFLNTLYNNLISDVCLFDDDVTVVDATKTTIDVSIIVDVDIDQINPFSQTEKDEIALRTSSAVRLFIDGGLRKDGSYYKGLGIGEDFIPHKLAVFLDKEVKELKDIKFNYPLTYTVLSNEEIASSGNVSVEVL